MNGLFIDNNIGEMFSDIFSEGLGNIFNGDTEFGLGELTINIPTGERLWYNFLPLMVIAFVVIIGLLICRISKKRKGSCQTDEISNDVEKIFAEAEKDFAVKQEDMKKAAAVKISDEVEPVKAEFILNKPTEDEKHEESLQFETEKTEAELIRMEKIEVVATKPAIKFGKDNNNITRSGRVFTEEELEALIRK